MSSIAQLLDPSDSNTPNVDDLIPIVIDGEEKKDVETEGFKTVLANRDKPTEEGNEAARVDEMEQEEMMLDDDDCRGAVELDDIPMVGEECDNDEMESAEECVGTLCALRLV